LKGNKRSIGDSNDFLKTEEIILDKEVYGQSEKLRNEKGITKQDILKEIIDKGIDKSNDKILVKTKLGKEITINFTDEDKKNKKEYQITLKIIPENELKIKREVYNVFDPEILDKSAEEIKELIVKTYKKEEGLKGITQNIEFKDGKVIHSMEVDMTVVNLEEMKKAMPNEVSGSGSRVSFLKTRKMLKEAGYTEQTN